MINTDKFHWIYLSTALFYFIMSLRNARHILHDSRCRLCWYYFRASFIWIIISYHFHMMFKSNEYFNFMPFILTEYWRQKFLLYRYYQLCMFQYMIERTMTRCYQCLRPSGARAPHVLGWFSARSSLRVTHTVIVISIWFEADMPNNKDIALQNACQGPVNREWFERLDEDERGFI